MDIYAPKGTKVVFNPSDYQLYCEPQWSTIFLATPFQEYTIEKTVVHSFKTDVYLEEFPGKIFNSIWFD